tara:strand:- start:1192 stop:1350 length:159 start_codon:yes stop_codon:yes gene_type:complete
MPFISRLINKRIANLINRFDIQQVPPQMIDELSNNSQIYNELEERIAYLKDN